MVNIPKMKKNINSEIIDKKQDYFGNNLKNKIISNKLF